jgi:tRNA G18 (ribose-2'-O)-methylase SpoU
MDLARICWGWSAIRIDFAVEIFVRVDQRLSLNVSIAAGVVLFEALRQRRRK